jgi:hypothetical protein
VTYPVRRFSAQGFVLFLATLCVTLFVPLGLWGQQNSAPLVHLEVNAERIEQFVPFVVTVFVDHPLQSEVEVTMPQGAAFTVEQVRTESRFLRDGRLAGADDSRYKGERWTSVEFLLTPQRAGNVSLGPFEVYVRGEAVYATAPETVLVRPADRPVVPELYWEGDKPAARVGESVVLTLRLRGGEAAVSGPVPFELPREALLEQQALSRAEREAGIVARVRLLPMRRPSGGVIRLSAGNLNIQNKSIRIPPLDVEIF